MMLARCPACQTTFRARPEHLTARAGRVRCGHCYTPFNALENLIDLPLAGDSVALKPSSVGEAAAPVVPDSPHTAPAAGAIGQASVAPWPSDAENATRDLDERIALALSPSTGIDHHLGDDDRIPAREERLDLHKVFTEPPELDADKAARRGTAALPTPAVRGADALRWSPMRSPGAKSPASLSHAVWPTLVAQPPQPETIQPGVFSDNELDAQASELDTNAPGGSWHMPPPRAISDAHARIMTDPDERPWRQVDQARREPEFVPRTATAVDTGDEYNPDFTRYSRGESGGSVWLWALMVGALLGMLAVQSTYVFRVELARQWPELRPVLVDLCDRLGCDMPLPRNAQAINLTASNLESDPNAPTRFILHARLRNEAAYLQAHPHLELTLTDARDRPVARRVLEPSEWLAAETVEAGFGGRTEVELSLPFGAPELTNATGYRLYAFFP